MKTATTITLAERFGHSSGRLWRRIVRFDAFLIQWLSGKIIGTGGAKLLLGLIKVVLVMILLFASIWLGALIGFVLIVSSLSSRSLMTNPTQAELRDGHSGVGVYDQNDWRIDPADIDDM